MLSKLKRTLDLRSGGLKSNTVWSLANEGLTLFAALFSVFLLIPRLGSSNYGAYAGMFALIGPFSAFVQAGVTLTVLEHAVRNDESGVSVMRSCLGLSLALACLAAPLIVVFGSLFIRRLELSTIIVLVAGELVIQAVWLVVVASVQGAHSYAVGTALRISGPILRMLAVLVIVVAGKVTLANVAIANMAAVLVFTTVAVVVARRIGFGVVRPGRPRRAHLRSTFVYGFGISASTAQNDGDKVVLNAYGFKNESGTYAAAYRLVTFWMVPLSALTNSTHYAVLKSAREDTDQLRRAFRFARYAAIYAVPMVPLLIVTAPLATRFLGKDFAGTEKILPLLAPLVLFRGLGTFALNGLLGLGRAHLRAGLLIGCSIVSIVLYIALIPKHSWHGAVVASLISDGLLFVCCWTALAICQRQVNRRLRARSDTVDEIGTVDEIDLPVITSEPL